MNDMEVEGQFVWGLGSSSSPANYSAFGSMEPNGFSAENCVALFRSILFDMADIPCENTAYTSPVQLCYN